MSEFINTINSLKSELVNLEKTQGKNLEDYFGLLDSLTDLAKFFEDSWVGAWGEDNYNVYKQLYNQHVRADEDYFYSLISQKGNFDFDSLAEDIEINIKSFQKFQQHLVTELSLIRDDDNFINENELLKSIEEFKWGIEPDDFIKLRRPSHIPIYDMRVLSRDINTPPHINVIGDVMSLQTKSYSPKNFNKLAFRLLRQVELKLSLNSAPNSFDYGERILNEIFDNFHSFCNQLKNRYNNRSAIEITDEYDVQDLLHCILKLHFKDVREEEYTPSYGGSSTRMDFLLKNEKIVIEVKKTRQRLTDKEIGEQLILDTAHYKNHPNCKFLKCFVYDPENRVKNPRGLENDLNKLSDETLSVELFIRP